MTGRNNKFCQYYKQFPNVKYINLDLNNPNDFDQLPTEGVEGLALISAMLPASEDADLDENENADKYIKVNTLGTINVLEYCRRNKIKRVISTVSYGDISESLGCGHAITEEEPRNFKFSGDHAAYVISKNAAADIMEYYNQQHDMKNAWFRLPPVYGVGPHGSLKVNGKLVKSGLQIFIDKASEGEPIEVFGDGKLYRDVVYVKDVAKAFYRAFKSERTYGLYNISSGVKITLLEQAQVCAEVFATDSEHKSLVQTRPEIANKGISYQLSIEKANKDFDYYPEFAEFKAMMIDWKDELYEGSMTKLFSDREA